MTGARIRYLLLLIAAAALCGLFYSSEMKTIFWTLIFLPQLSLLWLLMCRRNIRVLLRLDNKRLQKGEKVGLCVSVENKSAFFCPFFFGTVTGSIDGAPLLQTSLTGTLTGRRRQISRFEFRAGFRGPGVCRASNCYIEDFLRLFRFRLNICASQPFRVDPKPLPVPIAAAGAQMLDADQQLQGLYEDRAQLKELTPYLPTMDCRRIHWKLSARYGEIVVKEFEKTSCRRAAVIMDFQKTAGPRRQAIVKEDRLCAMAVYVLEQLYRRRQTFEFIYAKHCPVRLEVGRRAAYEKCMELCATKPFDATLSAVQLLTGLPGGAGDLKDLYVFTAHASEGLQALLMELSKQGTRICLFVSNGEDVLHTAVLETLDCIYQSDGRRQKAR